LLKPLFPELRQKYDSGGMPVADTRAVLNGVLWVMRSRDATGVVTLLGLPSILPALGEIGGVETSGVETDRQAARASTTGFNGVLQLTAALRRLSRRDRKRKEH